jgi:hypothetical protein
MFQPLHRDILEDSEFITRQFAEVLVGVLVTHLVSAYRRRALVVDLLDV